MAYVASTTAHISIAEAAESFSMPSMPSWGINLAIIFCMALYFDTAPADKFAARLYSGCGAGMRPVVGNGAYVRLRRVFLDAFYSHEGADAENFDRQKLLFL